MRDLYLPILVCFFLFWHLHACSCIEIIPSSSEQVESITDASSTEKKQETIHSEKYAEQNNPDQVPPDPHPSETHKELDPTPCAALSWKECHDASPRCLVYKERRGSPYFCREPQNACERKEQTACEGDASCLWIWDFCYCPPDKICGCGNGPPAVCLQRDKLCDSDEDCGRFCLLHFGCCSPRASCEDIHPGCEIISRDIPQVCRTGFIP